MLICVMLLHLFECINIEIAKIAHPQIYILHWNNTTRAISADPCAVDMPLHPFL